MNLSQCTFLHLRQGIGTMLVSLVFAQASYALETPMVRSVQVTGECIRVVKADRGSLSLVSTSLDKDPSVASKLATEKYEKLRVGVRKLGLKDLELETSQLSVNPLQEWENNKNVMKGFQARMGLTIETSDINRIGDVFLVGQQLGLKEIGQMSTYMSVSKAKQEKEACLEDAVKNARAKADVIAKASNAKIKRIISVNESAGAGNGPIHPIRPMLEGNVMSARMAMDSAPQIETKNEQMQVQISASFELE